MGFQLGNRTKQTWTGTGTGTLDLAADGGTVTGYQSFADALANSETTVIVICSADESQVEICETAWTEASQQLTRGTPIWSTTGSRINFSAGTKDVWIDVDAARLADLLDGGASAAHKHDYGLPERNATQKTSSFTAVKSNLYSCSLSGASANIAVTPPATPAAGDRFGYRLEAAHATNGYAVAPVSGMSIVGVTTDATNVKWHLFQAGEQMLFEYDGATWQILHDGRKPFSCKVRRSTARTVSTLTATALQPATEDWDDGSFYDSSSAYAATVKRPGRYRVTGFSAFAGIDLGEQANCQIYVNAAIVATSSIHAASTDRTCVSFTIYEALLAVGDAVELYGYHSEGANQDTLTTSQLQPLIMVEEIL